MATLMQEKYKFCIPCYQRPYEWEEKQVKALFEDLKRLFNNVIEESKNGSIKSQHFIGTMFWKTKKTGIGEPSELWIIDGQQRLTTSFLILISLKQYLQENSEGILSKESIDIIDKYLYTDTDNKESRLIPYSMDHDNFMLVQNGEWEKENINNNYIKTYKAIKKQTIELLKYIQKYDDSDIKMSVKKFINLINLLNIVTIELTDNDDPEAIFESINSKGKELTQFDLIRNFVLLQYNDKNSQEIAFNNKWRRLEAKVDDICEKKKDYDNIIRFFIASKKDYLCNIRDIYWETQKVFDEIGIKNPNITKEQTSDILIEELTNFVNVYKEIIKPSESNKISNILGRINRTDQMGTFMSLIVSIYWDYQNKVLSSLDATKILELMYSLIMRRKICELDIKNLSRLSPDLVKDFSHVEQKNYDSFRKILFNRIENTDSRIPSDKQVIEALLDLDIYSKRKGKLSRILLLDIENSLNGKVTPFSFEDKLSIEHVAPQNPSEEWLNHFDNDREKYNSLNNTIGNLTLVGEKDNSSMGNKFLDQKNNILKKSKHIILNEYILEKDEWNEDTIKTRTIKLAEILCSLVLKK